LFLLFAAMKISPAVLAGVFLIEHWDGAKWSVVPLS
jgi:hypothetical protein